MSCNGGIKEERVKQESQRSLQIALDYIKQQREIHKFDLNRKIRIVTDKLKHLEGKSSLNAPLKNTRDSLISEKADYELKLKILIANTEASTKRIKERWVHYNQSVDAMLQNMDDYLKGMPIDIDTIPKKDSVKAK
jgi:hypothetical protein